MNKMYRTKNDRIIAGVCGGLGKYTDIDSNLIRILYILLTFCSAGAMLIVYICACLLIPDESDMRQEIMDAEYRFKD